MPRPTIPDRRSALLDAAEDRVLRDGFDAVRIADVARDAGVAKGAVYLEFPSKDALLQALLVRSMHRMAVHGRRLLEETPASRLGVGPVYRAGVEALLTDRLATAAMLDDRDVLGHQVAALGPRRYAARVEGVAAMLRAFAEHGALDADCDVDGLAVALSSATLGLLSASSVFGPLTPQQLAAALDSLTRLVDRGAAGAGEVRDPEGLRRRLIALSDALVAQTAG